MSLHAVMTLNLCLESYGAAVHLMDSLFGTGVLARQHRWCGGASASSAPADLPECAELPYVDDARFGAQVSAAMRELEFEQARAIWLVDVCGCSYDQAAIESGVDRARFAATVAAARHEIRRHVVVDPGVRHRW